MEKESKARLEEKISELEKECQAIYELAIKKNDGVYNSSHTLFEGLSNASIKTRIERIRKVIKEVLKSYK